MPSPIAFEIFGREIRWYGILIASALLIGILIATKRAKGKNIIQDDILDILIIAIPCAIIGARLYYVLFNLSYYMNNPGDIIAVWKGGLAIHGGIIAGALSGYFVCRRKNMDFLTVLDIFAPCFPLGQAIGRWGNFFNQEAYGRETNLPWAITVHDPVKGAIHVHPTFLYESIWDILVFVFIMIYDKKFKKSEGELICIYAVLYSVGRFLVEGLRTDSLYFMGFRTAQIVSVVFIVIGSIMFIKFRRKNNEV